jgi:tetratricopeptide (TPR) repeat protein
MTRRVFPLLLACLLAAGSPALASDDVPVQEIVDGARGEIAAGRYEQAREHLKQALERSQGDPTIEGLLDECNRRHAGTFVEKGKALLTQRKWAEAHLEFEQALAIAPADKLAAKGKAAAEKWPKAEAYCKSARAYLDKGELDYAIAYYEKAYELTGDASIKRWLASARAVKAKQP